MTIAGGASTQLNHKANVWLYFSLIAAMMPVSACARRSDHIAPDSCVPFRGEPSLDRSALERLAGTFELVMSATDGDRAGETVRGRLVLQANVEDLRRMSDGAGGYVRDVSVPYFGTSDVDVTIVGALRLGGATSDDPSRPGVLVIQSPAADSRGTSLVLRLGTDGNVRDLVRFDGGYTALRVRYASRDTLIGEWASGTMTDSAAGHFCATR